MNKQSINRDKNEIEILKEVLIRKLSHEVRTPLSIIKEGIALLNDEIPGKLNPEQKKVIKMVKGNIDRLSRSIIDILENSWDKIKDSSTGTTCDASKAKEKGG